MTDSSESDTCDGTSGDDDPIDLEEIQGEPQGQEAAAFEDHGMMIKNSKTKIVHEIRDNVEGEVQDAANFSQKVGGMLTKYGKVVITHYEPVRLQVDWTTKCRICFHGRRASV